MVKIISSFYKKYSSASFLPLIDILIKQFNYVHPEDGELLDEKIDFCQYFTSLLESMTG
jgi:hypothetical protein